MAITSRSGQLQPGELFISIKLLGFFDSFNCVILRAALSVHAVLLIAVLESFTTNLVYQVATLCTAPEHSSLASSRGFLVVAKFRENSLYFELENCILHVWASSNNPLIGITEIINFGIYILKFLLSVLQRFKNHSPVDSAIQPSYNPDSYVVVTDLACKYRAF
jgi:hypothetical protein